MSIKDFWVQEKCSSFFACHSLEQWRLVPTAVIMQQLADCGIHEGISIEKAQETRALLEIHSHLLVVLFPVPLPRIKPETGPHIASFARRHFYKDAIQLLRSFFQGSDAVLPLVKNSYRLFSNSRLPEKLLAQLCGLGFIGRNTLLINPVLGSSFIIAGAVFSAPSIPADKTFGPAVSGALSCSDCRACVSMCPVGAIAESPAGFRAEKCLQYLATSESGWTDTTRQLWGQRLYGCMSCQEACPWNRAVTAGNTQICSDSPGYLELLQSFVKHDKMKDILPGTALEASWVPRRTILRNLIVAAANAPLSAEEKQIFLNLCSELPDSGYPVISHAIRRLRKSLISGQKNNA